MTKGMFGNMNTGVNKVFTPGSFKWSSVSDKQSLSILSIDLQNIRYCNIMQLTLGFIACHFYS